MERGCHQAKRLGPAVLEKEWSIVSCWKGKKEMFYSWVDRRSFVSSLLCIFAFKVFLGHVFRICIMPLNQIKWSRIQRISGD